MGVALVLPAAGTGSRFADDGPPKQLRPLAGRPLMLWSLHAFDGLVDQVVIPVAPELEAFVTSLLELDPPPCPWLVIHGGSSRQDSVSRGIKAVAPEHELVLVHDAARPLVTAAQISAVIEALHHRVAAVLAVPCSATVKRSADGHSVSETVPREGLWLAQTPQALRRTEALTAFAAADEANWQGTDDVSLMERAGHAVHLVTGDASNLKVTTPDDWDLAEAILHHRLSLEDGAL